MESRKAYARTDVCGPRLLAAIFITAKGWMQASAYGGQICKQCGVCKYFRKELLIFDAKWINLKDIVLWRNQ